MSENQEPAEKEKSEPFVADSLALGLIVLFAMAFVQRGIGLARSVGFCRFLDEDTLGQWAMVQSFVNLVIPIFLFGLPGSLVRFVEHFRLKNQLQIFVRRIFFGTAIITLITSVAMLYRPDLVAWAAFRDSTIVQPIAALTVALLAVVWFNCLEQLVSGLRQVRLISLMQFIHSVSFTLLSVAWLMSGGDLVGLIFAYAMSSVLGSVPAVWVLAKNWSALPEPLEPIKNSALIRRVAPYAMSVWAINLIGNVFDISDRYMILHFSPGGTEVGQSLVGEYYCARLLPILLISLGMLIGGALMPYMTADWERGRIRRVGNRMKQALLMLSSGFTLCAACGMVIAPWLFAYVLADRYATGLDVMPIAFILCAWSSLVMVSQDYLWCAEKGAFVGIALVFGLLTNIAMTFWLLPVLGLYGAVLSTAVANLVVLIIILAMMTRHKYPLDYSAVFAILMPATLMAGPWVAIIAVATVAVTSRHARHYFSRLWGRVDPLIRQRLMPQRSSQPAS